MLPTVSVMQTAFGNTYVGGFVNEVGANYYTGWHIDQEYGFGNFQGTSGTPQSAIQNVWSTAGWNDNNPGVLSGRFYQNGQFIYPGDNRPYTMAQFYNCNVIVNSACSQTWYSPVQGSETYPNVSYTYQTVYFCSCRTQITFYNEIHYNDGRVDTVSQPITLSTYSDSDTHFTAGFGHRPSDLLPMYLLQFGAELQPGDTTGWQEKQYSMAFLDSYDNGGTSVTYNLNSHYASAEQGGSAYITYTPDGRSWVIGGNNAAADAHSEVRNNNNNIPAGQVQWYYSSSPIPNGQQLWHP